ncbi:uncharacterized protein P174DRAFT_74063 [Aspergillus novofumigatus IBT 16806]|uniref:Uncharacterized protein n=1 Tax=Aspergillus novofumigatus (strain IBT 16806) TaxID=1392255 RepID=A0A2I1BSP7_ASPN1|nr:uncharacterized protein P174DRAFT_74063 [Aspergillus novofumigatus IBT 16806]PKX88376.1 hypothetical protein P174DRAFT_74063 [Aspergillus novofumigatus IBT 16806]
MHILNDVLGRPERIEILGPQNGSGPCLGYEGYLGSVIWALQIFSFFVVWLIRGVVACHSTSQVLLSDPRQRASWSPQLSLGSR